jgi:hypothetical protein
VTKVALLGGGRKLSARDNMFPGVQKFETHNFSVAVNI